MSSFIAFFKETILKQQWNYFKDYVPSLPLKEPNTGYIYFLGADFLSALLVQDGTVVHWDPWSRVGG